jgi:mitochondrial fission protein ELM1
LFLLFPLPLERLLLELGAEPDEVPLQEELEQASGGAVEDYSATAAAVLATFSRRISLEINMERTLMKDGRVANMVMLDAA